MKQPDNRSDNRAKVLSQAAQIIRNQNKKLVKGKQTLINGLEGLAFDLTQNPFTPQVNKYDTIDLNLRRVPFTFQRPDLSFVYMEYGIIRTAIDLPVDDALRGGVDIESNELDANDIKKFHDYMDSKGIYEVVKATAKWARLFGGAGLVVFNGQDPATKLDLDAMNEKSPLNFLDADRWELSMPNTQDNRPEDAAYESQEFFYYGKPLHRSRVFTMKGDTAPSLIRRMLMGWGLSEVDKMVRDLNQYIKGVDVIFELLDEAKVDVYKMENYKSTLLRPGGQDQMNRSIAATNSMKNYLNALVLDKGDDYQQKQLTFSGLAEMMKEIRIGIASTLRIPVTKLFGISASGFNAGEDDIENYNSMIESDIRSRLRPILARTIKTVMVKLFGYVPDFTFKFKSLRIMDQNQEMDVKTKKQLIVINNYDRGLMTAKEMMEAQRADGLLTIDKTAAEEGLTEDFPIPPVEKVTQRLSDQGEGNLAEGQQVTEDQSDQDDKSDKSVKPVKPVKPGDKAKGKDYVTNRNLS